jgi:hypothetical protein
VVRRKILKIINSKETSKTAVVAVSRKLYDVKTSVQFRNKKRVYLKDGINKFTMYNKNKNIREFCRGTNEFKRGCQSRNNLIKDDNVIC